MSYAALIEQLMRYPSSIDPETGGLRETTRQYAKTLYDAALGAKRIVEIGAGPVAEHVSGAAFCHAMSFNGGHLLSIDVDHARPAPAFMEEAGNIGVVWRAMHGNSCAMTAEEVRSVIGEAPIDLLYIDGDHSAEACLSDFERFAPLVRQAGLVIIDDYPASPGVCHAIEQLEARGLKGETVPYDVTGSGTRNAHWVHVKGLPM